MPCIRITIAALSLLIVVFAASVPEASASAKVSFKDQVKPILQSKCIGCHGTKSPAGELDLSTVKGMKKGGSSGKLFKAGKGTASLLVKRLKGQGGSAMPMGSGPLRKSEIELISRWIDEGAKM